MNNSEDIAQKVIKSLINNHLCEYKGLDIDSFFIGKSSNIDSIDIVGSITYLEEELDENGVSDIDLFDAIFENEDMTFRQLINFLVDLISNK